MPQVCDFPFSFLHCFLKEIDNIFSMIPSSYRNIRASLGELEKAVVEHSPAARIISFCQTSSFVSKLDRKTENVFYFLNNPWLWLHCMLNNYHCYQ